MEVPDVVKEVTDVRWKEPQLKIAEPNIEVGSRHCRDPFAPKFKRVKRLRVGEKTSPRREAAAK
jgi:hypothetical protein